MEFAVGATAWRGAMKDALANWPVERPRNWLEQVKRPQDEKELAALRESRDRGRPFGEARWAVKTAGALGLESTLRAIGRPKGRKAKVARV